MADVADIFADPARMELLVRAIERMSESVERVATTAEAGAKKLGAEIGEVTKEAEKLNDSFSDMERKWFEAGESVEKIKRSWLDLYKVLDDRLDQHHKSWTKMVRDIERHGKTARGGLGAIGGEKGLGLSGGRGVLGTYQRMEMSILGQLPMGGLIGLMLYGSIREEGFRATTAGIMRQMDRIGSYTRSQASSVNTDVRKFFREWGSDGQEIMATMTKLSEFSIGEERFAKVGKTMSSAGVAAHRLLTALDMIANLQPGTAAQAFGTAVEATGAGYGALTRQLWGLRDVARATGADFQSFMSVMTQGLSTLRLQRQGVDDLAQVYLDLRQGLVQHAGLQGSQATMAAMRGVTGITQAVGGLSEGLFGYAAQRIQRRTGEGPSDPFAAMTALRLGEVGGEGHGGLVAREIQKIMEEAIGGGASQRYTRIGALTKVGNMDIEQARAIVDLGKGTSLKDVRDALADPQKAIKKAVEARAKSADQWQSAMRKIMMDLAIIGTGLLMIIIASLKGIGAIMIHTARRDFDKASRVAGRVEEYQEKGGKRIQEGATNLKKVLGDRFDALFNAFNIDTELGAEPEPPPSPYVPPPVAPQFGVAPYEREVLAEQSRKYAEEEQIRRSAARISQITGTPENEIINKTRLALQVTTRTTTVTEISPATPTVQPEKGAGA